MPLIAKSGNGVPGPVFKFLLLTCIPSGNVLEVAGDAADLHYVMGSAFGTYGLAAQRAILDPRNDLVAAVAVIQRAHHFKMGLAAAGARALGYDMVAGVTFVFTLVLRN